MVELSGEYEMISYDRETGMYARGMHRNMAWKV